MLSAPARPGDNKTFEFVFVAATCAIVAVAVLYPIVNTDLWWHLAAGRRILQEKAFLRSDPWSSSTSKPWFDIHWGFQVLSFALYKLGGIRAIVIAKAAVTASGVLVSYFAVRRRVDPVLACAFAALTATAIWCARSLLMARPIFVSLFFISLFVFALERYRAGKTKGLWLVAALPLVQMLWSNIQPVFVLGWVIALAYAGGEAAKVVFARPSWVDSGAAAPSLRRTKVLALVFAGCVVASLVTPYGIEGLRVPFSLFFRIDPHGDDIFSVNVSENLSPLLLEATGQASLPVTSFKWIAAIVWGSFLLPPRRIDPARLGVSAAFFVTALSANRNILVFFWSAVPYAASNFAAFARHVSDGSARREYRLRGLFGVLGAGALCVVGFLSVRGFLSEGSLGVRAPFRVPEDSTATLERLTQRHDRPIHVFCSVRYGGYIVWRFDPKVRVAMDGRFILRSSKEFESYLEAVDHPEAFDALASKQGYDAVVLPVSHPQRYQRLVRHLARSPDWTLTETDGAAVVFVSRSIAQAVPALELTTSVEADRLRHRIERRYPKDTPVREQALINLGRIHSLLGNEGRALLELARVVRPDARVLAGRIRLDRGEFASAIAEARTALAQEPGFFPARLLLAEVALAENNAAEALEHLEAVLESRPGHKRARELLKAIGSVPSPPLERQTNDFVFR